MKRRWATFSARHSVSSWVQARAAAVAATTALIATLLVSIRAHPAQRTPRRPHSPHQTNWTALIRPIPHTTLKTSFWLSRTFAKSFTSTCIRAMSSRRPTETTNSTAFCHCSSKCVYSSIFQFYRIFNLFFDRRSAICLSRISMTNSAIAPSSATRAVAF